MKSAAKIFIGMFVCAVVAGTLLNWISSGPKGHPSQLALKAMEANAVVSVVGDGHWYIFTPTAAPSTEGVIFHPDDSTDVRAYSHFAKELARQGITVLAKQSPAFRKDGTPAIGPKFVIDRYPDEMNWVFVGHGSGASDAANSLVFLLDQGELDYGRLVLWAGITAPMTQLRDAPINAIAIYGTDDENYSINEFEGLTTRFPPNLELHQITGANHLDFGSFEGQDSPDPFAPERKTVTDSILAHTFDFVLGGQIGARPE